MFIESAIYIRLPIDMVFEVPIRYDRDTCAFTNLFNEIKAVREVPVQIFSNHIDLYL